MSGAALVGQDGDGSYVSRGAYGVTGASDALALERLERRCNELEGQVKRLNRQVRILAVTLEALRDRVD